MFAHERVQENDRDRDGERELVGVACPGRDRFIGNCNTSRDEGFLLQSHQEFGQSHQRDLRGCHKINSRISGKQERGDTHTEKACDQTCGDAWPEGKIRDH